ncbi:QRFP-like peptide receptor [Actinia tenebrosa]|uniref:QRFP-like peptide receptor n=1 Tax=Actinia tenebrosa TaxID=6105 RepID=A0A6P8IL66_ACTTE|nr:QRFP-like peptide receptor [Actinia tenebrosa]
MSILASQATNKTLTSNTSTRALQNPPWIISMSEDSRISLIACYCVLLLLAVFGNSSVVAIVCKNRQMQTTMNFLIVNMAVSDLAGSLVTIPRKLSVLSILSYEFDAPDILGKILCKLCPFIRDVSITISIESMVAIALDRFLAVVYPMRSKPRILNMKFMIPLTWFAGSAMFSLNIVLFELKSFQEIHLCLNEWPVSFLIAREAYYGAFITLSFIVPTVALTALYFTIVCKIKSQAIPGQRSLEYLARRRKQNTNIIKLSAAIVLTFFVCWLPHHTLGALMTFVWKGKLPKSVGPFFDIISETIEFVSFMSFATNPVICLTFSSKYKDCMKKLILIPDLFSKQRQGVLNVNTQRPTNISQEMITLSMTNLTVT